MKSNASRSFVERALLPGRSHDDGGWPSGRLLGTDHQLKINSWSSSVCPPGVSISMIKPELAFIIIFTSNLAAPLLAFIAGRKWPHRRKALHLWAVLWIILSIFICYEVTVTPNMLDASDVDPNGEDYEGLDQFLVLVSIFLQQMLLLALYGVSFLYSTLRKWSETA